MADAVTTRVVANTPTHYVIHCTNISDGTGESAVIKADKSTLVASDGAEPASLDIEMIRWAVQGFTSVRILWDHTTDDLAMTLSGGGFEDYSAKLPGLREAGSLADPRSSGGTGDILVTTAGAVSGATYDFTAWLRKNPD